MTCTLDQRWGSATAKEKEKYIEKSIVEYSKEGVLLKVDCFEEYPICRECVPPAASLAKGHAEDWSCTVGKDCCHDTSDVLIEPKQNELCGESSDLTCARRICQHKTFKPMQHCKTC